MAFVQFMNIQATITAKIFSVISYAKFSIPFLFTMNAFFEIATQDFCCKYFCANLPRVKLRLNASDCDGF